MITVEVDDTKAVAKLTAMPKGVHDALLRKIQALRLQLEAHIKNDKLSGQVLNVISGDLRRSIFSDVDDEGTAIYGRAASSGDVKYAAIHEFGGTTPAHDIFPTKANALAFMMGGQQVFAKVVHHPGSTMPERSYMRSSLADMSEMIVSGMRQAVTDGLNDK